jgi:ornithine--oxo-acid transaminase
VSGDGAWVRDRSGTRHLDLLAAYSALNFGHRHPRLVAAAHRQLDQLTLTSRAFSHDLLAQFCDRLAALTGLDLVLPMNTGAEAVETAIKAARRWGHVTGRVADGEATIVVCQGNFHGRTTTIVSFSDDDVARSGFGPFTPGFVAVPHGDAAALRDAIDDRTVAFLVEPVQGEAGVVPPPAGYLAEVRRTCDEAGILFMADEIQSGLGRTGATFACDHAGVRPDVMILGKALGGGIVPLSAVASRADVLDVLTAGRHGSTFGGNPLACAIGLEVIALLESGAPQEAARVLGARMRDRLLDLQGDALRTVRTAGLWAGLDIDPRRGSGRWLCEQLLDRRVLAKETHGSTIRLAPPLVIEPDDLDWGLDQLAAVLA